MTTCARCRRQLEAGEERRVPRLVVLIASFSLAFAHAGMWANEELRKPYCARCRRRVIPLVLGGIAFALALVSVGLRIWLRGPR